MKRLAVYTSIDGEIYTKEIKLKNPDEHECYLLKIPQGRVLLIKCTARFCENLKYTELWIESGKESLANRHEIIEKAYSIYTKTEEI